MTDYYVTANVAHSPMGEDAPHEWAARRCVWAESVMAAVRLFDDVYGLDCYHDGMRSEMVSVECRPLDRMDPDEAAEAVRACGYTGWMAR